MEEVLRRHRALTASFARGSRPAEERPGMLLDDVPEVGGPTISMRRTGFGESSSPGRAHRDRDLAESQCVAHSMMAARSAA